ncbi:hypothetical protein ACFPYI_03900 [Halomarina salina]|uniref:DUF2795 domain-containing protein n=1 Tax=Halomarina salina TaxID=1872699 RepID=A0ABD5RJI8_9EURY|nr:hypothetical protein [Halomarina salina]
MTRSVKLSRIDAVLADHDYPTSRAGAASAFDDVTLLLADGETNLGEAVQSLSADEFDSADDLRGEVLGNLPRNAVGEPYQSEGEG